MMVSERTSYYVATALFVVFAVLTAYFMVTL